MHMENNRTRHILGGKVLYPLTLSALCILSPALVGAQEVTKAAITPPVAQSPLTPNDTISLKYDLTRSDLSLMKLSFNISLKGTDYTASHSLKSKGLVKIFSDTKSSGSVEGKINKASLAPKMFYLKAGKKNNTKTAKLIWEKKNISNELSPALSAERTKSLKPVLKPNLKDPLSGLLSMVLFDDPGKPCDKTIRVFEGRKIFDLSYSYVEPGKLKKSDLGSFRGETHICNIKHTPIAGYSEKKMKKAAKANEIHKVWIARIKSPTSEKSYFVPVKAIITTNFGNIDISLNKGKINGSKLRKTAISLR